MNIKGVITALVTPFLKGELDLNSLEKLVGEQLADGIDGFVVNGTTGESPTLEIEEIKNIFEKVKAISGKEKSLILGTGSNSTKKTIEMTQTAQDWGADAALVVVPYYNKPTQTGLYEHFKAVAKAVKIPIILYNVPGRTITALDLETIKKLSEISNIVGIKEASGNIDFARQIKESTKKDFILLSGDDGTYDDFVKAGGTGVISVASHILPKAMKTAQVQPHLKLINLLFSEANPIPVKAALHFMGVLTSPELRLPLTTMSESKADLLKQEMKKEGLL